MALEYMAFEDVRLLPGSSSVRVWGSGIRDQGLGFRVQGSGFRV